MKLIRLCAAGSVCFAVLLVLSASRTQVLQAKESKETTSYIPPRGFVPDSKTAIRIAVAVWSPIYGEKQIQREKPYEANLKNGVWQVEGSLQKKHEGGVAYARISKRDGRILSVIHTK